MMDMIAGSRMYVGYRRDGTAHAEIVNGYGAPSELPMRLDLASHSPTGFEWGYRFFRAGSGHAQLALAIVADVLRDDARALRVYQEFRRRLVATWPRGADHDGATFGMAAAWSISAGDVARIVAEIESDSSR